MVKTATVVVQMLIRTCGVMLIVLGLLFWLGTARSLIPIHMLLGITLVLGLWALAGLTARAGVSPGLAGVAAVWGLLVLLLGLDQTSLLPGPMHWLVQVAHLLVGLGAIGLAEVLGGQARRSAALSVSGRPA